MKAVAAVFQKDPQVLIAHPDTGVNTLADLKGHPDPVGRRLGDDLLGLAEGQVRSFTDEGQVRKYTFNNGPFLADKRAAPSRAI